MAWVGEIMVHQNNLVGCIGFRLLGKTFIAFMILRKVRTVQQLEQRTAGAE